MTMPLRDLLKRARASAAVSRATSALPLPVRDRLRSLYHKLSRARHVSTQPLFFDDRSHGRSTILIILAGYKPELWPRTLERIQKYTSAETTDICVVCSGHPPAAARLREIAAQHGWSFLQTDDDRLAHAQNLAIARFPNAAWIAKLDEDMFVTPRWLEKLAITYKAAEAEGRYQVGFVAPLIPVNGFGYRLFLDLTGHLEEFSRKFPQKPPTSGTFFIADHVPEVTEWLWRKSHPLDDHSLSFESNGGDFSVCPHRFSIGAFLMARSVWKEHGGFAIAPEGVMGFEESEICKWCMEHSHAIVVSHSTLVGHFSFFPQFEHMIHVLRTEPDVFR